MTLDLILFIAFLVVALIHFFFMFMPLGNEDSTVRRLPWVTFSILGLSTLAYFAALPVTAHHDEMQVRTFVDLNSFLSTNGEVLGDVTVREKLKTIGIYDADIEMIEDQLARDPDLQNRYERWLAGAEGVRLKEQFDRLFDEFTTANEGHFYNKFGIAQRGKWKPYQFITYAFVHANSKTMGLILPIHLLFNMIAFFAVGFSLEDLWGRALFTAFYLMGAAVSALPDAFSGVGLIGASGAVSATMGAFLIRLPKTRLKIGWCSLPLVIPLLALGKKPYGIIHIPGYVFLAFYFVSQLLLWWFFNYKLGTSTGVSYKCHIAGFAFGMGVALLLKAAQTEEKYIHPKIEAKVSFSAGPVVAEAIALCDKGEMERAERKLKTHLTRNPDDLSALMALIQVYQSNMNFDAMNSAYSRLIRYHLARRDKEAALITYDNLLASFPEDEVDVRLPPRDWLSICEYLRELDLSREAAVEYERFVSGQPEDKLTLRACVQGGECAVNARDYERGLRLFERASQMNPPTPLSVRIEAGLATCRSFIRPEPPARPAQEPIMREPRPSVDIIDIDEEPEFFIGQIRK